RRYSVGAAIKGRVWLPPRPSGAAEPKRGRNRRTKTKGLPIGRPFIGGAAGRIRTHDPLVRSQVLYPTELQPHAKRYCLYCTALLVKRLIFSSSGATAGRENIRIGGAAGRIRTHDPLVRSQVLYPTELQPHAEAEL